MLLLSGCSGQPACRPSRLRRLPMESTESPHLSLRVDRTAGAPGGTEPAPPAEQRSTYSPNVPCCLGQQASQLQPRTTSAWFCPPADIYPPPLRGIMYKDQSRHAESLTGASANAATGQPPTSSMLALTCLRHPMPPVSVPGQMPIKRRSGNIRPVNICPLQCMAGVEQPIQYPHPAPHFGLASDLELLPPPPLP